MLTGTKRSGRVFAASLLLLATAAAAAAQTVTTPKQHFGFNIGDDYQLATYTQFVDYWQKLDKESDRMKVVEIGKTAEGRPQLMAIITSPENHKKLERYKEISRKLATRRGADRRPGARAREGRQGRRLVRRRPARDRSPRRASADRDGLSARQPHGRRDDALPERPGHPRRARQSRRHGARVELVHARERADAPLGQRPAAALPEVHRPRQQPRLLHVDAAREHEHEPRDVHRVVPADHVQPSPDRTGRHGDVRAAVPRSVQLQLRSAHSRAARPRGGGDAQPLRLGRQARRDEPEGLELLDLVERRPADDGLLPQHDRPADRDDRQSDADEHSVHPVEAAARFEPALPDRAAGLALPPVDRLFGDRQLRGLRHRVAQQGELPLQHLPDGEELDRARQPRQLDGRRRAGSSRRRRRVGGGAAAAAAPAARRRRARRRRRAAAAAAAARPRTSRSSCAIRRRATRAASSCRPISPTFRRRPSSSTRSSRPA